MFCSFRSSCNNKFANFIKFKTKLCYKLKFIKNLKGQNMKILKSNEADFKAEFKKLVNRSDMDMKSVMPIVTGIIDDIKSRGDEALNEQIAKFDKW